MFLCVKIPPVLAVIVLIEAVVSENSYSVSRDSGDLSFIADRICGCNAAFYF